MTDIDWRDLQYLQALAKNKSLSLAAETLNVNRTTVTRRIEQLEKSLNTKLVERVGRSLVLTPSGAEVFAAVEGIDGLLNSVSREVYGRDQKIEGVVKITAPSSLAGLLGRKLAELSLKHPGLILEVDSANSIEDLDSTETDIALRLTDNPPEHLIGKMIGEPRVALYANDRFMSQLAINPVIDYLAYNFDITSELIERHFGKESRMVGRSNSIEYIKAMVSAGRGVAALPCLFAEPETSLVRICPPVDGLVPNLWMLYHPRLRTRARIKIVAEALASVVTDLQSQLEVSL